LIITMGETADRRAASASRLTEAEQNRLIIDNMKLVPAVAAGYRGGSIDFDDLEAIGREGLVKAARSFDPDAGTKFSTWAWIKIQSEITTALRRDEPDLLPRRRHEAPEPDRRLAS
jgi:RNA polymerase sigma factor (sigma-70 family)